MELNCDCELARERLSAGLDGALEATEEALARAHTELCAECRLYQEQLFAVHREMLGTPALVPEDLAASRSRILDAVYGSRPAPAVRRSWLEQIRWRAWQPALVPVLALALIALWTRPDVSLAPSAGPAAASSAVQPAALSTIPHVRPLLVAQCDTRLAGGDPIRSLETDPGALVLRLDDATTPIVWVVSGGAR